MNFLSIKTLSYSLFYIFLLLFNNNAIYSETPSATTTANENPLLRKLSKQDQRTYEISLVEYEMLANRKVSELKLEVKARLLFTLERLVALSCANDLNKSNLTEATYPECEKFKSELIKLHSQNPVGQCAKYGYKSEICAEAYQKQYLMNLPTASEDLIKLVNDYNVKLWSASNKNLKLDYDLHEAMTKYNQKPNIKNKLKIYALYRQRLANSCENTSLYITEDKPPKEYLINYVENIKKDDPLAKMISDFDKKKADQNDNNDKAEQLDIDDYSAFKQKEDSDSEAQPKLKKFWRIRFISSDCRSAIKEALVFDPYFPEALCIKEGFYSPNCLVAKDKFIHKNSETKNNNKVPSLGLSTF